mgnify:CR=1 FL=1
MNNCQTKSPLAANQAGFQMHFDDDDSTPAHFFGQAARDLKLEEAIMHAGQLAMRGFGSIAWRRYTQLVALRSTAKIAELEAALGLV